MKSILLLIFISLYIQPNKPSEETFIENGYLVSTINCQPEDPRLFFKFLINDNLSPSNSLVNNFLKIKGRTSRIIMSNGYFHSSQGKSLLENNVPKVISMCEPILDSNIYMNHDIEILPVRLKYTTMEYKKHDLSFNPFSLSNTLSYYINCDTTTELFRINIDSQKVLYISNVEILKDWAPNRIKLK